MINFFKILVIGVVISFMSKKRLILILFAKILCLFGLIGQAGAHSGHNHADDDPNIKIPAVVARVNGKDISNHSILKKLKSYIRLKRTEGQKVTPGQEKTEVKRLINFEIGRELLLQHAGFLGIKATQKLLEKKLLGLMIINVLVVQLQVSLLKRMIH